MTHLKNKSVFSLAIAILACLSSQSIAQEGFLSDASAARAGLTVAWSTQIGISVKAELVDWQLIVDEDRATTYYVISYGKRKEVIAEIDLSPFGVPYGVDGAKAAAEDRKEIIEFGLRNDGKTDVEVEITSYALPRSTLFALGAGGQVICLDADTGATRWSQQVGDFRLPSIGLGASKNHVAVANGSTIYCLDFDTGRILWDAHCTNGIDSAPTCSKENIYVPLVSGRLQTFPIEKIGLNSYNLVAEGGSRARPLTTENHVVWTTEKGHMNVAPLGSRQTVDYRLKTDAPIISQAAHSGSRLFVGCLDGFVYGVNEMSGIIDWNVSTGKGILTTPVPFGDELYIVSRANEMFKVDINEGTYPEGWQMPVRDVRAIAGFGVDTIYCVHSNGRLFGINRETRAITKTIEGSNIQLVMPNRITDRMFFATKGGFIQCVHEISSLRPRFLETDLAVAKPKSDQKKRANDSAIGEENPFGSDEAMGEDNPFNSGDADDTNPFGGDSKDDDDDADDSNPFGNG